MDLQFKNKKIAVLGFSPRTGLELVKYLNKYNVDLIVSDSKSEEELADLIKQIDTKNIQFDLGGNSKAVLEADLIILSPGVPYDLDILKKARRNGIDTISEIEFAYQNTNAEIIAVTGTNGKTTTTDLISAMLKDLENRNVITAGNIGIPFISVVDDLNDEDLVVLELSSFQLEAVKEFKADIAIYLNYSPDHLDRHKTEENYKNAKFKVFNNQSKNDYAIINIDDNYLSSIIDKIKAKTISVSAENHSADLIIKDNKVIFNENKSKMVELLDLDKISLPGLHNKKNIAFAALASYLSGQSLDKIQTAAECYKLKEHRMEILINNEKYLIIDDSKATNPEAAVKAIESIDSDIILIAGGQDRNADFDDLINVIKKRVKKLLLIGETAEKISDKLKEYNIKTNAADDNIEVKLFDCLEEAAAYGVNNLKKDQCLLLSPGCPSWDMFASYKERGDLFKKIVFKNID
jgi:UDP-N-acetylmuramoylalanine--D-glutamate ligase